jgi:hypothetical protein
VNTAWARYDWGVRDVVFVAVVVGFFSVAAAFVRVCGAILGPGPDTDVDGS